MHAVLELACRKGDPDPIKVVYKMGLTKKISSHLRTACTYENHDALNEILNAVEDVD